MDLGKVALVTGASAGIGKEVSLQLAAGGVAVALASNVPDELREVEQEIVGRGGRAVSLEVDLSSPDEVAQLVARTEEALGPLDVLVNNAGIGYHATLLESDDAMVRKVFEVNFFAVMQLSRLALVSMKERRRGSIVNVSSASARRALGRMTTYAATKGAMHAFSQALRLEAAQHGVKVSEVLPISVATKFFDAAGYRPQGLVQTPEHVAAVVMDCIRTGKAEGYTSWLAFLGLGLNGLMPNLVSRVLEWREARQN